MKFTYNWLKDFVDVKIPAQRLADKLTMAGIEVESLESKEGDFVFQIEITSNRPDWLSVIGLAREVAAISGAKIKFPNVKCAKPGSRGERFQIKVEDKKDCPLYTAKIIRGVKVGPAPEWMRKRLELIGCRSINNIVDITNYILFTYGHPLHAFDLDKLGSDTIIIRRAADTEKIVTINDKTAGLDREILVIADKDKPVAVAGVIGGKDTEVTQNTKAVLLESAVFNPVVVRRSRQKLGLQTESSYRFERGTGPETALAASLAATNMIREFSGGICLLDKATPLPQRKKKKIVLSGTAVERTLGIKIAAGKAKTILKHLGFSVRQGANGGFTVEPPAYRQDIEQDVDLIEELARVYGYEHIPATLPQVKPQLIPSLRTQRVALVKNILCGLGLNEAITYSLVERDLENGYLPQQESPLPVEVLNPLSREQEILKPLAGPSLVKCVAHNLNQKQECVNIFEITNVFPGYKDGLPREECVLGIALCGERSLLLEQGLIKEKMGLLHLKGILETVFCRMGIAGSRFVTEKNGEVGVFLGQKKVAMLKKVSMGFLQKLDIKNKDVFTAEVYLDDVFARAGGKKEFRQLPLYPAIVRDISLVLREGIRAEEAIAEIKQKAGSLLEDARVVDYYKGKQIAPGLRSLTISCIYRSSERTLTEEEISPLHNSVLRQLADKFGAQTR